MENSIRELKRTMRRNLVKAYKGWWVWHRVVKRYRLGRTKVILLPGDNIAYNYNALLYLDQMLRQHSYESAVVLSVDPVAAKAAELFSDKLLAVETISRKKAEQLMQFYCLYEFDERFVVASLDEPEGRNAYRLIGKNGTTVAELVAIGVYRISQFESEKSPAYIGQDPEIAEFIKCGEGT